MRRTGTARIAASWFPFPTPLPLPLPTTLGLPIPDAWGAGSLGALASFGSVGTAPTLYFVGALRPLCAGGLLNIDSGVTVLGIEGAAILLGPVVLAVRSTF